MAAMVAEKLKGFTNPRIQPGGDVARHFADDVFAVLEPLQFDARRRGPNRLFTFFAVVPITHRTARSKKNEKSPRRSGGSL